MTYLKNFNDLTYNRIDFNETRHTLSRLIETLKKCNNSNDFLVIFKEIIRIQNEIEEMYDYADIRNMRDSGDATFTSEIDYWNELKPQFDNLFLPFYDAILNSEFKNELKSFVPNTFFLTIEYQKKITSPDIAKLSTEEQKLKQEYRKLISGKVDFRGEMMSLSKLAGLFESNDRVLRKEASDAYNNYFYERESEFDKIFIELIKVRKEIAKTLGFENYLEYSLYKLRRIGYDYKDISAFRDSIRKHINPIIEYLRDLQKSNLNTDEIKYYDTVFFQTVPKPIMEGKRLLEEYGENLKQVDENLYNFFIQMLNKGYIDLESRDNKVGFSITNYLCKSKIPVITGSFENTYYDVTTISHELGHAYQKYNASIMDKNYIVPSLLKYPTMEIAEMFSHALVIILLPYLKSLFSEKDYNKYCFQVIYDLVDVLSYICLVDEFQEVIYTSEEISINQIHDIWLNLSKKYGLLYQNSGNPNLDNGCFFFRQNHIFLDPFYYIDYGISTLGALSLASACENNLKVFKEAAKVASYYSLKELSEKFSFKNPFKEESVKELAKKLELNIKKYYEGVE